MGAGSTSGLWWQRAQGKEAFKVLVQLLNLPRRVGTGERPCGGAVPRGNTACPGFSSAFIVWGGSSTFLQITRPFPGWERKTVKQSKCRASCCPLIGQEMIFFLTWLALLSCILKDHCYFPCLLPFYGVLWQRGFCSPWSNQFPGCFKAAWEGKSAASAFALLR